MNYVNSIKSVYSNYLNFKGRAARSEFWWFFLFYVLASYAVNAIPVNSSIKLTISLIFGFASTIPYFAVACRRMHDSNRSGIWFLLTLLPFSSVIYLYSRTYYSNGVFSTTTSLIIAMIVGYAGLITLGVLLAKKGTEGPNKYGPDPLEKDSQENLAV